MNYKIIGDSSLDINEELQKRLNVSWAPLRMTLEDETFIDDENLNLKYMMEQIDKSSEVIKSAAPAPSDFLKYMSSEQDGVFIITLSSQLSASYNSAMIAKDLAKEKFPGLKVHVIDSLAASSGQTSLAIFLQDCFDQNMDFETIVEKVEERKHNDGLYFLLDNIDTLVKNGRMSLLKGLFAQLLHIKPILSANEKGEIDLVDKARTYTKALEKLAEHIYTTALDAQNRVLVIAQCFAQERAEKLKEIVSSKRDFKDIVIVPMKGLSSVYANVGGLVCAY